MKENSPFTEFFKVLSLEGFKLDREDIKPDLPASLATCGKDLTPSVRIIYIKKFSADTFFFFTNKNSRKGKEIMQNPNVSLCFFFQKSFKQIRIEGKAFEESHKIAEDYFKTRPALSKAGAILSHQSHLLENYEDFLKEVEKLAKNENLACPENWVCYGVKPEKFEFWEGTQFRLHLRTLYEKKQSEDRWQQSNLYP
jgi:pyridoxamine 5'-phosphate oxidase